MKKGLLIWNVALTVILGFLIFVQFRPKKESEEPKSTPLQEQVQGPAANPFRIAYFEMDSIEANLLIVREAKAKKSKMEEENDSRIGEMRKNLQQKFDYYQAQAQAGKLTATQSEAATAEMKRLDDEIRDRKQQMDSDLNDFVTRNQSDIQKKIENFLKEYNKEKNYAYIFVNERGLFYYCDTAYNITADVIKGLNEQYSKNKKD